MTNRDDQEGDSEKAETGGNELELPDLDEADFESIPSAASSPETDIPIDVDATELDEVDADIIDISDEEVQQEFEQMDKEEQEAGNPAVTLSSAETAELKTAGPIQQDSPNFDVPEAARDSSVDSKKDAAASANTSLDSEDHATSTGLVANYFRNLSPKLFYGSVSAVVLTAAVLWFVSIGTEQPSVAAEQALLEAETGAEQNAIFVDAGPEDPVVAAPALDLALNVAEELPPAEATEPAAEENISIVGAQPAVLEEAVPAIEEAVPIIEEAVPAIEEAVPAIEEAVAAIEEAVPAIEIATSAAEELPIAASPATPAEIITLSEITGNFYIIIASFLTEIKAREHAVSLSTSQETPIIISPFGASRRYRVAIAGFETMAEAQASLPAYKRTYGDDSWPLRYIVAGTTTLLRTGTDKFHVIVASFATEALARKHTEPLAASGENPSIIPPFGQSQQYRVALFAYDTLEAAQAALPQHRLIYASDAWLLRY